MIAVRQNTYSGAAPTASLPDRLPALDGWRGISILLVLAAHLLPLGPKAWKLNQMAGPLGTALGRRLASRWRSRP